MSLGKYLFWSVVTSLPMLFLPDLLKKRTQKAVDDELGSKEPADGDPNVSDTVPAEFRNFRPPPMIGYSRMRDSEVPASIRPKLPPLLAGALGTITKLPTDGRDIAAVIEVHYHEPGGPAKPWGYHKGVSLYERKGALA